MLKFSCYSRDSKKMAALRDDSPLSTAIARHGNTCSPCPTKVVQHARNSHQTLLNVKIFALKVTRF